MVTKDKVFCTERDGIRIIHFTGSFGLFSELNLERILRAKAADKSGKFILDLTMVESMDKQALEVVRGFCQEIQKNQGSIVLIKPLDPSFRRIVEALRIEVYAMRSSELSAVDAHSFCRN